MFAVCCIELGDPVCLYTDCGCLKKKLAYHMLRCPTWPRSGFRCVPSVVRVATRCVHVRLTHWVRVTHICVGKLTIIGSDNGLSPDRRQAIIWTNAGLLLIGPLGINFSEIFIEIQTFSLKKMRLKMSSAKCCSFHWSRPQWVTWYVVTARPLDLMNYLRQRNKLCFHLCWFVCLSATLRKTDERIFM